MLVILGTALIGAAAGGKRCVFLHGLGETETAPPSTSDNTGYWGGKGLEDFLGPQCAEKWFVHENTVLQGWEDAPLQTAYCSLIKGSNDLVSPAMDTIVITHSMGNNVLAGAILNGVCSLGAGSRWISLSAPWRGSKAADFVIQLCANPSRWSAPIRWLAKELNYCDGHGGVNRACALPRLELKACAHPKSLNRPTSPVVDMSMQTTNPRLANGTHAALARRLVHAALCGTSAHGLVSEYSVPLEALSEVVGYGEDNDGMVQLCIHP